jgi:hypothetical protein
MLKAGAQPLNVSRHGRWSDGSRALAGYAEGAAGFGDGHAVSVAEHGPLPLAGRRADDQPDALAAGGPLPRDFLAGLQCPLDPLDVSRPAGRQGKPLSKTGRASPASLACGSQCHAQPAGVHG